MTDTLELDQLGPLFAEIGGTIADADYSSTLEPFLVVLAADEGRAFAHEETVDGTPWAPLKPATIKRKGNDRILVEHGALIASLVTVGGPNNIAEVHPQELIFGTSDPKALFHQYGTSKMPARPPVGLSRETLDRIADAVADRTVEIMRG